MVKTSLNTRRYGIGTTAAYRYLAQIQVTGRQMRRMPWLRRIQRKTWARDSPQFLQDFYAFVTELLWFSLPCPIYFPVCRPRHISS